MIDFLKDGKLPSDQQQAKKAALQDSKNGNRKRAVVPKQLQKHKRGNPVMNSTARKKVKSSAKNRTAVKKVQTARVELDLERGVM